MKRRLVTVLLVVFGLLCALGVPVAFAGHPDIPRITIDELKTLIDKKVDVVILDAQLKSIYDAGHIKGAISFPWKADLTDSDVSEIPKDKLVVTYCDCGPGETDSSDLAFQLLGLGFPDVKILLNPAIRGWKKLGYPLEGGK
ncbi:hypothetical protein FO488_15855 [Geobacter sp. FeAm09]|uniref:rhodanese-like domain-containing protein n=1 Tax=Geobacter sp. FeAm09 TaxID=2597769 RepID=UPI0011EBF3D6|nr:rhodanese-like domain-containing protein [Geobacter sp. FeAm09]QEM69483.1 hypothetical protein FO488_15855 [Geobacter sp. FeAm09]